MAREMFMVLVWAVAVCAVYVRISFWDEGGIEPFKDYPMLMSLLIFLPLFTGNCLTA